MAKFRATKLSLEKRVLTQTELLKCAAAVNNASLPCLPTANPDDVSNPTAAENPGDPVSAKAEALIKSRRLITPPEAVGDEESGGENGREKKRKWKR